MRKTTNFGVGKRQYPGAYPEDIAKLRATVSPGEYTPSHNFTKRSRAQSVTMKSRFDLRPTSAMMPGPGRYDTSYNPRGNCRTVRFGTGGASRSRPSSSRSCPGISPASYNTRGMVAEGGSGERNTCMASCRFRGKSIRDSDPVLREKGKVPGPGSYNIARCFEGRWSAPCTPKWNRPFSAMSCMYGDKNHLDHDYDESEDYDTSSITGARRKLKRPRSSYGRLQSSSSGTWTQTQSQSQYAPTSFTHSSNTNSHSHSHSNYAAATHSERMTEQGMRISSVEDHLNSRQFYREARGD